MKKNYFLKKNPNFNLKQKLIASLMFLIMVLGSSSLKAQSCTVNANDLNLQYCVNDTMLLGVGGGVANVDTILWQQVSGPSVIILNPNILTAEFIGAIPGTYEFELDASCTIVSGGGRSLVQLVTVTVFDVTQANAGSNIEGCPATYTLSANTPNAGEAGNWAFVGGNPAGALITDPSSPTSTVTFPETSAGVSTLEWVISNSNLNPSPDIGATDCTTSDTITLTNYGGDLTVFAGLDQNISECYTLTTIATLTGSNGGAGLGGQDSRWEFVSGPSVPVPFTGSPISGDVVSLTGLFEGTYVFKYLVDGPCASGDDTVQIIVAPATQGISSANAGPDQVFCVGSVASTVLTGSSPSYAGETVEWIQTSGTPVVESVTLNTVFSTTSTTTITFTDTNPVTFRYRVIGGPVNPTCTSASDEVTVSFFTNAPTIELDNGNDVVILPINDTAGSVNITTVTGGNAYSTEQLAGPVTGSSSTSGNNLNFSGLTNPGTYTFKVTRYSAGEIATQCNTASDFINIIVSLSPDGANAGTDTFFLCGVTSGSLAGNIPTPGTGGTSLWSQISGPATGTMATPTNNITTVSGLTLPGEYVFRYTITGGPAGTDTFDDVTIYITLDNSSAAGTDRLRPTNDICPSNYITDADPLLPGQMGTWTVSSAVTFPGGAPLPNPVFTDVNNPITTVTGLQANADYVFRWTVAASTTTPVNPNPCAPLFDDVIVQTNANSAPSFAVAGPDQCISSGTTTATLGATALVIGTGTWTLVNGPNIPSGLGLNNPSQTFTGLVAGTYEFLWTTTNGACQQYTDSVIITVLGAASNAGAGSDQLLLCFNNIGTTSVVMAATSSPASAVGTWAQTSGVGGWIATSAGGVYPNPLNDPNVIFSNLSEGAYEFEWQVAQGTCDTDTDSVQFSVYYEPADPVAGVAQGICFDPLLPTIVTLGADPLPVGSTGTWSVVSGPNTPTVAAPTSPTSLITGLATGVYTFRWTSTGSGVCSPKSDDVTITITTPADAGPDRQYCNTSSFVLIGNDGTQGTWTSTGAGTPTITNGSNNTATVTIDPTTTVVYEFTYTITFPSPIAGCATTDTVSISNDALPTIPNAGTDQVLCTGDITEATMNANSIVTGTGTWALASGAPSTPAQIGSTDPNETFTGLVEGIYIFEWVASNGACTNLKDVVRVEMFDPPVNNGIVTPDGSTLCQLFSELEASAPGNGIGTWTLAGFPGTYNPGDLVIDNPNNRITSLTSLNPNTLPLGTYTFEWTVSIGGSNFPGGACAPQVAVVNINYSGVPPAPAVAGTDQTICNLTPASPYSITLNASTIYPADSGLWTLESTTGSTPSISSPGSETTNVSGLTEGVYVFKWSVSNTGGGCTLDDTVQITITDAVANANAGPDQNLPETSPIIMAANNPIPGQGFWTFVSGPTTPSIIDVYNPNTQISGTGPGTYEFMWTVQNSPCAATSNNVLITLLPVVNLSLDKQVDNGTPNIGDAVTFTLDITNGSGNNGSGINVLDNLPSGLTLVPGSIDNGGIYNGGSNSISWSGLTINAGVTLTLTYQTVVDASGSYVNSAEITALDQYDPNSTPGNGSTTEDDDDVVTLVPIPIVDISLQKTVNNMTPYVGDNVIFTLTVSNDGPSDATVVEVTDVLPSGYTLVGVSASSGSVSGDPTIVWTVGVLANGANETLQITATVNATGSYQNFAEVTDTNETDSDSTHSNGVGSNEDDDDSVTPVPVAVADLELTKTVDDTNPNAGDTVVFSITVLNNGPSTATDVDVFDYLPSGFTYVSHNFAATSNTSGSGVYNNVTGNWVIASLQVGVANQVTLQLSAIVNTTGDYTNFAEIVSVNEHDTDSTPGNTDITEDDRDFANVVVNQLPIAQNDESLLNPAGAVTITDITATNGNGVDSDPDGTIDITTINLIAPVGATSITFDGDTDTDGFTVPGEGVWALTATGEVTFTPQAGFTANPTPINYTIEDNDGDVSNEASIIITYVIIPPAAVNDESLGNTPGNAVTIDVLIDNNVATGGSFDDVDNDLDGVLDATTVSLIEPAGALNTVYNNGNVTSFDVAGQGNWSVNSTTGAITFTPETGFTEDPTIVQYNIEDNDGNPSNNATIIVDYLPIATDDVSLGNVTGVDAVIDILANDTEGDIVDPASFVFSTLPVGATITGTPGLAGYTATVPNEGTWTYNGAGILTFNPDAGFTANPTDIQYTIDDLQAVSGVTPNTSQPATVSVAYNIESPVAVDDYLGGLTTGTPAVVPAIDGTLGNDYDMDAAAGGVLVSSTVQIVGTPNAGDPLVVPNEGTWTIVTTGAETANIIFTPLPGFTSDPTPIYYTVEDNDGNVSNAAKVTVDYIAYPPITYDDVSNNGGLGHVPGTSVTLDPTVDNGGLGPDIDGDAAAGGTLDFTTVSLVTPSGALNTIVDSNGDVTSLDIPSEGTWSVDLVTGFITFTPISTFNDDPTPVLYNIEDNDGNVSNNSSITIDYAPIATDDINAIVGVIGSPVSIDVTLNDLDGDIVDVATVVLDATSVGGVQVSPSEVSLAGVGVWLDNGAGTVTFTPDPAYTIDPPVISYTINDAEGNSSNLATITFDYAPIAIDNVSNNGGLGYPINLPVTVDVLANDITGDTVDPTTVSLVATGTAINIVTDANGDITSFEVPGEGTWNVDLATGEITFSPAPGFILSPTPINYNVEDDEGNQSNNALVTITYVAQADIEVVKTDNSDTYTPGLPIVYTITVTNNGPADATGVIVNDDIVAGLEAFTTWTGNGSTNTGDITNNTITTLNSGDSVVYTVTINVPSSYTGDIVNTASAALPPSTSSSEPVDPDPSNNSSTDTDTEKAQAALVVNKTVDNPTPNVGTEVVFTITVTNVGPSDATNIDVLDVLPTGYTLSTITAPSPTQGTYNSTTGLWDLGSLVAANGTLGVGLATLTITAIVNESGNYTNTAELVYADQEDPNSIHGNNDPAEDDQDEATTVPVAITDLVTTKTVDNNNPNEGDIITYTITVVNNGPSVATSVSLIDQLPTGIDYVTHLATGGDVNTYNDGTGVWSIGTIDIGASATLTIDALVTVQGTAAQIAITNTTTAAAGVEVDLTTAGDDLVEDIIVTASELVTTKTINTLPIDGTYDEGDTFTYTITVENQGPSNATGVSLVDLLPAGVSYVSSTVTAGVYNEGDGNWEIGDISDTGTETLTITVIIDAGTASTDINNITTAAIGDQTDPEDVLDDLEEEITIANDADIVLTKVVDNANPNTGDTVTYTITVTNNGEAVVTNLVITDALPAGLTEGLVTPSAGVWSTGTSTWDIGTLAVGETETMTIEALVTAQGTLAQTPITNTATHAQDQLDTSLPSEASVDITVTSTDLVTLKTVSLPTNLDGTYNELETFTYYIEVTNYGPSNATGVSLVDLLPDGVTYVSDNQGGAYNSGDGNWLIGDVAASTSITLEIVATVDALTSGDFINNMTTVASGDQTDPDTINQNFPIDDLEEEIEISNESDIVITKVVDNANPNKGDTVTYTITISNNGPAVVTNLVVSDVLPIGLTEGLVTPSAGIWTSPNWTLGTLAVGETETMTIEALVTAQGTLAQTPITNTATHAQDQLDTSLPSSDSAIITVTASDLVTVKAVNDSTPSEGDTIVYSIAITNNGPSNATGVSLTDLLPAGVTYVSDDQSGAFNSGSGIWTLGDILTGVTATLNIIATVDEGTAGDTIVNTTTTAVGDQTDPTTVGDDLEATIEVENFADIVLTKTVDNSTPNVGDTVTYTITVKNNGPAAVTNLVVTDALPVGLTYGTITPSDGVWTAPNWNVDNLESGEEETIVIEAIVGMDQGGQTLVNTISNTQNQVDSNITSDDDSESITVTSSDLVTVKTVNDSTPNEGDTIVYSIAITNNGPSNATGVSLTDLLPAGVTYVSDDLGGVYNSGSGIWTVGSILSDASVTLNISATVDEETSGTTITNTTTAATGDQSDPTTDGDELAVDIVVSNQSDIILTKVVDNATPNVGDTVTYTVTVTNNGSAVVTNLVVIDALPTGLTYGLVTPSNGIWTAPNWAIGELAVGVTETITIQAIVGMDQGGQTLVNTISNTQDQVDSDVTSDDDSESITVTSSDLETVKTVDNATPNEGDTIVYTITVSNNGPSDATGVSIIDNLPVGVTYASHSTTYGMFNNGSGNWEIGNLENGETAVLTISAVVDLGTVGQTITNSTSAVTADQSDSDTSNNSSSVSIIPTAFIDLNLTKTVVDDVVGPEVGDIITFEIRVDNEGPTDATGVQVTDLIPSGYDFVNYSSTIGTYNPISGLWNIGEIEIGKTAVLLVDVEVLDTGDYENCAEVTAANEPDIDSSPNNGVTSEDDYDCAAAPPYQEVDLSIEKTVVSNNLEPLVETEISFEIRLKNNGIIDATEVIVTDLLPTGYTFVNYSSTRGTYDFDSGIWDVGVIVNGETEVLIIDVLVNTTGDYTNCVTISSLHQVDPILENNSSCISTSPIAVADLELTKDVDEFNPIAESNVDFTIVVTNNGPSDATGVIVRDLLPSGYDFVSFTSTVGSYDENSGIWNIGTIDNQASQTLIITAYVFPIGEWTNIAEIINSNELDLDSTPDNDDIYEDDQAEARTEPIIPLTIPEGFTPNGDGINDLFEIEHLQVLYPNFEIEIVNRYGNIVYKYKHNGNPNQTPIWWNGYSDGRWNLDNNELPTATYFYTIYFNNDDRKPQTGWVYLRK